METESPSDPTAPRLVTESTYTYPQLSDVTPLWLGIGLQLMIASAILAALLATLLAPRSPASRQVLGVVACTFLAYLILPAIILGVAQTHSQRRYTRPSESGSQASSPRRHVILTDVSLDWPLHSFAFAIGGAAMVHGSLRAAFGCAVAGWVLLIVRLSREWWGRGFIEVGRDSLLIRPAGAPGTEPLRFSFDDQTLGMSLLKSAVRLHTRAGDFDIPLYWTSRPKTLTESLLGKVLIVTDRDQSRADDRTHR